MIPNQVRRRYDADTTLAKTDLWGIGGSGNWKKVKVREGSRGFNFSRCIFSSALPLNVGDKGFFKTDFDAGVVW